MPTHHSSPTFGIDRVRPRCYPAGFTSFHEQITSRLRDLDLSFDSVTATKEEKPDIRNDVHIVD